jgi:GxxExxY protein
LQKTGDLILGHISFEILSAAFEVHNTLGPGFLEKIYQNAMVFEMTKRGLTAKPQQELKVFYKGTLVGSYFADLVVNEEVIVELKAVEALTRSHEAQLLNYLKATDKKLGLLVNFGKDRVEHKRLVL